MKVVNFLICDDIRNEMNHKISLIGVYDDSMDFLVASNQENNWPKVMTFSIFIKIKLDDNDIVKNFKKFTLIAKYNNKDREIIKKASLPENLFEKSNQIKLVIKNENFLFEEKGTIKFILDFFNENNEKIETLSPDCELKINEKVIGN